MPVKLVDRAMRNALPTVLVLLSRLGSALLLWR